MTRVIHHAEKPVMNATTFEVSGLRCLVVFDPRCGCWIALVSVPDDHPLRSLGPYTRVEADDGSLLLTGLIGMGPWRCGRLIDGEPASWCVMRLCEYTTDAASARADATEFVTRLVRFTESSRQTVCG